MIHRVTFAPWTDATPRHEQEPPPEGPSSMKINVTVDCTPEEARAFFGLPDVKPMQDQLMGDLQERLRKNIQAMDPETMLRTWLPATIKGFEQWQQFLSQLGAAKKS
jgi:hypothetical protein